MYYKKFNFNLRIPGKVINVLTIFLLIACGEKRQNKTEAATEAMADTDKFEAIFDGTSLSGWDGDDTYWHVEDGVLVGEITPETLLTSNTFIIWQEGQPEDFELKLEFRISESGNSGINYRSERLDSIPFALRGYQADIDGMHRYTGQNYEERKRTTLAYRGERVVIATQDNADTPGSLRANVKNNAWQSRQVIASLGNRDSLKSKIKDGWNDVHLFIKGNMLKHYVNGVLMSEVTDNDSINRKSSGWLGMQVHVGPPMKVEYRNILLKRL